ncbi:sugar ABC transporter permease [Agrobacterium vitis]|uniref:ABC transporter permease subunit n=1 Tax=Agrobacterium vitis TaxID=373 RepID=A0AAE4WF37_AGRVI|nr:sugar ABC transporter permease [Agrobacterium vitis]MCF1499982.1 sugar ABC transporter permease [Allorhizobium sp. Av2]MCM2442333.1 sugar ABC transporter permease [Agrobacterium vitis]MUZ58743.1 ABC transporter permease subunit [Agrobacterium vitis]MVA66378.1 ABC transporter permease subunit [Agrobacterium vitis]MVA88415.1 ABC transporter permease subunit [Agrobacterium vitis]
MMSLSDLHSHSSTVASKRFSYAVVAGAFAAPAFLLLVATVVAPIFVVVLISLTDYRLGRLTLNFVGLGNYVRMINDPFFWAALQNSALYTAIVVPVSVFGALCVAVLLDGRRRSRRFYEIVYFLPVTSTLTAMSIVWSYLLNGHIGPLASLLEALGLPALDFFADGTLALIGLAIIGIWHLFGFNLILFLAGLTVISSELKEASALDGMDSFWDRLRYMTWPLLAPTTIVVVVLSCIQAFQVFDTVAVLTNGGPYGATEMLLHKINTDTFTGMKAGYGSALTVVYLLLIGTFSIVHVGLSNRKAHF